VEIVIDTSAIIAVITNEPNKAKLINLTIGATLFAPLSIHWEIGNAFSAMLKRQRASLEQVEQALLAYQQIPIRFVDIELTQALRVAARLDIYAYDAYLIACAEIQGAALLSLDRGLIHAAKVAGISVLEVQP
jgi:predicted nucleic acid-binding protein